MMQRIAQQAAHERYLHPTCAFGSKPNGRVIRMSKAAILTVFVLLSVAVTTINAQAQTIRTRPAWEMTFEDPEQVRAISWASSGRCAAVATTTKVHVVSDSGEEWVWDYARTNRLISSGSIGSTLPTLPVLAVSPTCDVVALAGSSSYKYVWTADRQGRTAFLKTEGTPSVVKFSADGEVVAVATAASLAYVLSPQLKLQWRGTIGDLPVKWQLQQVPSSSGRRWTFLREDVEALSGVLWGQGIGDSVSEDGRWRAVWDWNYRGATDSTTLELWGPEADGYRGRDPQGSVAAHLRWSKPMGCTTGEITADGMFVIAIGDQEHPENSDSDCADDSRSVYVFDRDGNTISVLPYDERTHALNRVRWREAVSGAAMDQTGRPLVWQERKQCWDVPALVVMPDEAMTAKWHRVGTCSPDSTMLLVTTDSHHVQLYRRPE
jgi:hypothetical protein